ncbi:MAG: right-handed parallel beta-helix repeat-containing protein [Sedimentisphaerales bacterium]|nr:right-handed parallel beta-helix repeat-containing protein [Sedimentisphaerales bacterium]
MNFQRYFISIVMIFCALSVSCFAAQKLKAVAVSGGEESSLVVVENGWVFSAGAVLGHSYSTVFDRVLAGEMGTSAGLLENITAVGAGWVHAIALTSGGQAVAWGDDYYGELGNGNEGYSDYPVWVHAGAQNPSYPDSNLCNIIQVAAGRSGTHSLFVDSSHNCYATGNNDMGQCGINTSSNDNHDHYIRPQKILAGQQNPSHPADPNYPLQNIIAISGGEQHSMALETLDSNYPTTRKGRVYTFGDNLYGKLGINNIADDKKTTPQIVVSTTGSGELVDIVAISSGWDHCMALQKYVSNHATYKGRVYCWGNNGTGNCGDGYTTNRPYPVQVLDGEQDTASGYIENIVAIGAGENHGMALDANGFILCWGSNHWGQLGAGHIGDSYDSTTPVKVVGLNGVGYLSNIVKISAGYWHNLAIDSAGRAWSWGQGGSQLGTGMTSNEETPRPIPFYSDPYVLNKNQSTHYTLIQDAVDDANNGDTIIVSPGVYKEQVNIGTKQITLQSTDPNDPMIVAQTVISAPTTYPITSDYYAVNIGNSSAVLDGLTIANGGSGVLCSASPIIARCVIRKNDYYGVNCASSSAPVIKNCIIGYNFYGIYGSSVGAAKIINSVIANNGGYGISIANASAEMTIRNCTIKANASGGIYRSGGTDPNISNCILWNNANNNLSGGDTFTKVTYNCINNGYGDTTKHNISTDPCFVTPLDYHIKAASLCKNKGNPSTSFIDNEMDIDGELRKNGTARVDIGADELYGRGDFNGDDVVNFIDYATFANTWGTTPSSANWNAACDIIDDNEVNYKDLDVFTDRWLMPPDQLGTFAALSVHGGSPVLSLTYDANTPPDSNGEITVYVHTDVPLISMAMYASVVGDANITSAMSTADCNQYGWNPQYSSDPNIEPNGLLSINGATPSVVDANTVVGYFKLRPNSGQITVAVTAESIAHDINNDSVTFSTAPLTINCEPNQVSQPSIYLEYEGSMTPDPNTEITVYVHSDVPLFSMGVYATVSGDATITSAMGIADCNQYGWDPQYSSDPYIDDVNGLVGIGGGIWGISSNTPVGYFQFIYHSGQVNVAITTDSYASDANSQPVTYSTDPLIFGGESMQGGQQQSMMGGTAYGEAMAVDSLQQATSIEEPAIDVNELANWAQDLWNNDAELRATTTEEQWQNFIDSIKSSE